MEQRERKRLEEAAFTWRPLKIFNYYRLILASFFFIITFRELPPPLGQVDEQLFRHAALFYMLFSLTSVITITQRSPRFIIQLVAHVTVDIIVLEILTHASGGLSSGMGMLQIVTVAIGGMVARGRIVMFFAAISSIAVLFGQTYTILTVADTPFNFPQAGILGITLFTTAWVARVLGHRARESEALARERGVDLANMSQLTQYIIEQMQTGVVVIDAKDQVVMMSRSARSAINLEKPNKNAKLIDIAPQLANALASWRDGDVSTYVYHINNSDMEVIPHFMQVGRGKKRGVLIFLDDASRANREAQQIKLASLGRLTASIAHEVRNPLGAISHAAQLLNESPDLSAPDQRLLQIVNDQSKRINVIIENILALGRSGRSQPIVLDLVSWLERFVSDFNLANGIGESQVSLYCPDSEMKVYIDPTHLHQILWNLCRNGLQHSADSPDEQQIEVRCDYSQTGRPYLEVRDFGPGVSPEDRNKIFEPFFTTHSQGTGLGLYLSRELAEANHGRLEYIDGAEGACFRLSFTDPQRLAEHQ